MSSNEVTLEQNEQIETEQEENIQVSTLNCLKKKQNDVKKNKRDNMNHGLKQQNYQVKYIYHFGSSLLNDLNDGVILIKGDVILPLRGDGQFSRLSNYNKYKKIVCINYDQEIATLEMVFETLSYGIGNFDHIIDLLSQQPNQEQRTISNHLICHKKRIQELQNIQQMLKQYQQIDMIRDLIEQSFQQFVEKMHIQIKAMYKEGQIGFFKYNIFKVDYENADYQMTHCSTSELLLALIGLDPQQAQQFMMRKGILEVLYHSTIFGITSIFLQLQNDCWDQQNPQDFIIKTFDGIDIYAKTRFLIFQNDDPFLKSIFNTKMQHFMILQIFEISQNQIDFLLSYRKASKQKFDLRVFDNEQDWEYNAKAQSFIEKFYCDQK
ncbi:hypothetical protein ABPG72_003392 [Tetrahymena utriculariae]